MLGLAIPGGDFGRLRVTNAFLRRVKFGAIKTRAILTIPVLVTETACSIMSGAILNIAEFDQGKALVRGERKYESCCRCARANTGAVRNFKTQSCAISRANLAAAEKCPRKHFVSGGVGGEQSVARDI